MVKRFSLTMNGLIALIAGISLAISVAHATVIDFNGGTVGELNTMTEDGFTIVTGRIEMPAADPVELVDLGSGNLAMSELSVDHWAGSAIVITRADGAHFTLDSFWAWDASGWEPTQWGVMVEGYLGGVSVSGGLEWFHDIALTPTQYFSTGLDLEGREIDKLYIGGHEYWGDDFRIDNINLTVVPEPASMLLLASGLIGLAGLRRKFKKS